MSSKSSQISNSSGESNARKGGGSNTSKATGSSTKSTSSTSSVENGGSGGTVNNTGSEKALLEASLGTDGTEYDLSSAYETESHYEHESSFENLGSLKILNDTTVTFACYHFNQHKHLFLPRNSTGGEFLEALFGEFFETCEVYSHLDCWFSILDFGGWEHKYDLFDLFTFINNFSLSPTHLKNNPIFILRFGNDPIKYRMRIKEIIKESIDNRSSSVFSTPTKPLSRMSGSNSTVCSPASPVSGFTTPALTPTSPVDVKENDASLKSNSTKIINDGLDTENIGSSSSKSNMNSNTNSSIDSYDNNRNRNNNTKADEGSVSITISKLSHSNTETVLGGGSGGVGGGNSDTLEMRLEKLKSNYNGIRAIAGDGNCYFRAVLYAHLEFIVAATIQKPEAYSRNSITLLAEFFDDMTELIDEKEEHQRMVAILKEAAIYKRWVRMAEIQCDFLNKSFDKAFIKASRMMLSIVFLMYKDVKVNDISQGDIVTAVYENKTLLQYCEESIEKMKIEAEGSWVDLGLLPAILNARCRIVYFDPSPDKEIDLAVNVSEFSLKTNIPSRQDVKKFMEAYWTNPPPHEFLSKEQVVKRLKVKYECMKKFLRAVDPENEENRTQSVFRMLKSVPNRGPCVYDEPLTDLYLLFRAGQTGHYDTIYPISELSSQEPRYFYSPTSIKYAAKKAKSSSSSTGSVSSSEVKV